MRTIPATKQEPGACSARRRRRIFLTQIAKSATNPLKNSPYQSEEKATYKIYTCKMKNGVCVKNPPGDTSKVEHIAVLSGPRFSVPRRQSCRRLASFFRYSQDEQGTMWTTQQRSKNLAIPPSSSDPNFLGASCKIIGQAAQKQPLSTRKKTTYKIYTCKMKNPGCAKNHPNYTSKQDISLL